MSVVEVGTGVPASWCGKVFADLGADVLKVEPSGGDPMRSRPGAFANLNTNKRSVVIDGDIPPDLFGDVDLVIDATGPGGLADLGVDIDALLAQLPACSVVAISGFGATGPYEGYSWSAFVAQSFGGAMLMDARGPVRLPMSTAECIVGQTAAMAGLAAVLRARATGTGAVVDCAAYEALATNPSRAAQHLGWEYRDHVEIEHRAATSSSTVLPLGPLPCVDGYVAMMMTPQQLGEMIEVLDDEALSAHFARPDAFALAETKEILDGALYPWLLSRTRQEITDAAQAVGWPVVGVNAPHEVLAADHLHQRGFWQHAVDQEVGSVLLPGAPYRFSEGGWKLRHGAPSAGNSAPLSAVAGDVQAPGPPAVARKPEEPPLSGIRVLDITTVWSGPLLTMHLADLGAEVIRVESPHIFPPTTKGYAPRPNPEMLLSSLLGGYGQPRDDRPDRAYNRHAMNNSVNRGKLSCTLDVRFPEQREMFFELVKESDIFIEDLKLSTLHQMGIHETELLEANPQMIVLRLPPAGLSGDWSHYTGFGGQFDGLTSLATLSGHRNTTLMETPTSQHMDTATGPAGVFALLAALHYRAATGRGQLIELAQSENVLGQLGDVFADLQLGHQPTRHGNRDAHLAPQGLYPCRDDRILALTVTDDEAWIALATLIGRADLASGSNLSTERGRQEAHDEIDEAITEWTSTVSAYEAFHSLQEAGVAAAPLLGEGPFASDPHVVARDWIQPLPHLDIGTFGHLGPAFRGIPLAWDRGAPALGQHNEYVFKELLGLDDAAYQRLIDEGIASEDYLDSDGNPY
jgi:crotonobetainyl-CoA:carnitine CoA-transferase CaiB-like acyl-CoA transferase